MMKESFKNTLREHVRKDELSKLVDDLNLMKTVSGSVDQDELDDLLSISADTCSVKCLSYLLSIGAHPNFQYGPGRIAPLHQIALRQLSEAEGCARALLAAGADPKILDMDGNTPLHILFHKGDGERSMRLAKILALDGVVLIRNSDGFLPEEIIGISESEYGVIPRISEWVAQLRITHQERDELDKSALSGSNNQTRRKI